MVEDSSPQIHREANATRNAAFGPPKNGNQNSSNVRKCQTQLRIWKKHENAKLHADKCPPRIKLSKFWLNKKKYGNKVNVQHLPTRETRFPKKYGD